ncbi:MAG: hypothetical protein CM15mP62_28430 [Rhodospirillaceae bacterium]|nr:MAG: hypothetical protein CM15mP62_28430 [Rhodospirillaceae bacterium]
MHYSRVQPGVIAATKLAAALNIEDIITYDMGGTSTDACMIRNGSFNMNPEGMVIGTQIEFHK